MSWKFPERGAVAEASELGDRGEDLEKPEGDPLKKGLPFAQRLETFLMPESSRFFGRRK